MSDFSFALNFSSSNFFCMIGMIWNQYFLSVELIFFFPSKKVLSFFFSFIPLYAQLFSSHPDNSKAKYWVSKGSLFLTALWKVLSCSQNDYCQADYCLMTILFCVKKKKIQVLFYGLSPLWLHSGHSCHWWCCVSIEEIWLVKIYTLKWFFGGFS